LGHHGAAVEWLEQTRPTFTSGSEPAKATVNSYDYAIVQANFFQTLLLLTSPV
jgi:hypothetical protein